MKKRWIALVLAVSMALPFAGCGAKDGGNASAKPEQIEVTSTGTKFQSDFRTLMSENPDQSLTDLANALVEKNEWGMEPMVLEVEPGLLNGFDNAEITGFQEGVMIAPMINAVAFVSYVFRVEDGVEEFTKLLKDSANPGWNVCVCADETIVDSVGNVVFFIMCPSDMESGE